MKMLWQATKSRWHIWSGLIYLENCPRVRYPCIRVTSTQICWTHSVAPDCAKSLFNRRFYLNVTRTANVRIPRTHLNSLWIYGCHYYIFNISMNKRCKIYCFAFGMQHKLIPKELRWVLNLPCQAVTHYSTAFSFDAILLHQIRVKSLKLKKYNLKVKIDQELKTKKPQISKCAQN